MRSLILTLVASTVLATPALAQNEQGHAYGKGPKVCLVSFANAVELAAGADSTVTKAQYLPLAIAQKLQLRNPYSGIWTYGADGYAGAGVTNIAGSTTNTEDTCAYLAEQAESNDED